jgi:hypothetical protein
MAIDLSAEFPGQCDTGDAGYPYGKARNVNSPGAGDGTPWEERVANDMFGFQQALLSEGGLVPSGVPDAVGASQYLAAAKSISHRLQIKNWTIEGISGSTQRAHDCDTNGRGTYVLVADDASGEVRIYWGHPHMGMVAASTVPAKAKNVYSVAWLESAGLFIAVGQSDVGDSFILTSPTGDVWTERANTGAIADKYEVRANAAGTRAMIVGRATGGSIGQVITTTDATGYTVTLSFAAFVPRALAYSPTLDLWVMGGGNNDSDNLPMLATLDANGAGYAMRTRPAAFDTDPGVPNYIVDLCWAGDRFVAITACGWICYSLNGVAWVSVSTTTIGAYEPLVGKTHTIAADPSDPFAPIFAICPSDGLGNQGFGLREYRRTGSFELIDTIHLLSNASPSRLRYLPATREYVLCGQFGQGVTGVAVSLRF